MERKDFLQYLRECDIDKDTLIEVLVGYINDYEIRAAVDVCKRRQKDKEFRPS